MVQLLLTRNSPSLDLTFGQPRRETTRKMSAAVQKPCNPVKPCAKWANEKILDRILFQESEISSCSPWASAAGKRSEREERKYLIFSKRCDGEMGGARGFFFVALSITRSAVVGDVIIIFLFRWILHGSFFASPFWVRGGGTGSENEYDRGNSRYVNWDAAVVIIELIIFTLMKVQKTFRYWCRIRLLLFLYKLLRSYG